MENSIVNARIVCNNCPPETVSKFITNLENNKEFTRKSYVPISENSHLERFSYLYKNEKASIVYDTKARILTVTFKELFSDIIISVLSEVGIANFKLTKLKVPSLSKIKDWQKDSTNVSQSAVESLSQINVLSHNFASNDATKASDKVEDKNSPQPKPYQFKSQVHNRQPLQNKQPLENIQTQQAKLELAKPQQPQAPQPPQGQVLKPQAPQPPQGQVLKPQAPQPPQGQVLKPQAPQPPQGQMLKPQAPQTPQAPQGQVLKPQQHTVKKMPTLKPQQKRAELKSSTIVKTVTTLEANNIAQPEYKNGYTVKDCDTKRFDKILENIKKLKGVNLTKTDVGDAQIYEITDKQKSKLFIRYLSHKKILTMQGKRSNLFSEVQMIVFKGSDYLSAVSSHIKMAGKESKASTVEKQLKKLIPNGFEFLSEQSKIDFTIGLIDINNKETKLSDYSVLLVPPYRGLERLIYDLQMAENINVKMIGQAFEKNASGEYSLKSGYQKKIQSIVYNEVLTALYTEYFKERNFLTHSDNTLDAVMSRAIRDKKEAKTKFDNLLDIIEYNCKKLNEILFSLSLGVRKDDVQG